MPIEIRHGWRTRVREVVGTFVTFAAGVIAATDGAGVLPRLIGAVVFVAGSYAVLDALVLASSWRLVPTGLKIPTLVSRHREIPADGDLAVSAAGRWVGALAIEGARGTRFVTVNPLVSPTDLRRWFADIADANT